MILRLLPLLVVTFFDSVSLGISVALLPNYLVALSAPDVAVGFMFSLFALCQVITGPAWMYASERIGRKPVIVLNQAGATAGWLVLAASSSVTGLFVARAIEGLTGGNWSLTMAYVTNLVEPDEYTNAFAYANATSSAGIIVGPLLGGLLEARAGFTVSFYIAATLQALSLAAAVFFLKQPAATGTRPPAAALSETLSALKDPRVMPMLAQQIVITLSINGWFAISTIAISVLLNVDAARASETFAMFGIWTFVMELLVVGRLTTWAGARTSSNLGLAALIAAFSLFAFAHDYATLVAVFMLFSFGFAVHEATMPAMLTRRVLAGQRGMILETSQTLENVTKVVMPPISTGLLGASGPGLATGASAVIGAGALGMGLALQWRERHRERAER